MKIEINQKQLLHAVTSMSAVAGKTKSLQILDNIEVTVGQGKFVFRAVSGEATLTRTVDCTTEGEGRFLVNCAQLLKYIATLPDCPLTIEIGETDMIIRREKGSGTITISPAEMFPVPSEPTDTINFTLPADYLLSIVRDGSRFVGDSDLRPHLKHIYIRMADGKMTGYATDTRVLYLNSFNVPAQECVEFYLNSSVFPILLKMLTAEDTCEVSVSKTNVQISCNGHVLCFNVPVDKYPNAERILPKKPTYTMRAATAEMKESITRVMALAEGKTKLVKMSVSMMDAIVRCDNTGYQSSANESFGCECDGEITIGFDGNYMARALASAGDNVTIGLDDKNRPMLFTSDHEPGMKIVLMPMVIHDEVGKP